MKTFFRFVLTASNRTLSAVIVLGALGGFAGAALVALIADILVSTESLDETQPVGKLALLLVMALCVLLLELMAKWLLVRHSAKRARMLRVSLAHAVLRDSLRKLETTGTARLLSIYTEDISLIRNALNHVSTVGVSLFVITGCLVYLSYLAPGILLTTLAAAVPLALVSTYLQRRATAMAGETFAKRDVHTSGFKSILDGTKELRLNRHRKAHFLAEEFVPSVDAHEKAYVRSIMSYALGTAWTQFAYFVVLIAALGYIMLSGEAKAELLAPFALVAFYMRSYLSRILAALPVWSQAGVILNRLEAEGYNVLSDSPEPTPTATRFVAPNGALRIDVDRLSYHYIDSDHQRSFTVGPLCFSFKSGEIVFIVGRNGAGKSTFVKLLSGLYESDSGSILCNGIPISRDNLDDYRQLFSVVFTVPFVFDQVVYPETLAGPEDALESSIAFYLDKLQLAHKVRTDRGRLETTQLSHGQTKRLALLSAYMEERPVIVFDEWAENQDPAFKNVFYNQLLPELRAQGKLVVVISHEARHWDVADRELVITAAAVDGTTDPGHGSVEQTD